MKNRALSLMLSLTLCLGLTVSVSAYDMGKNGEFHTVGAGDSYVAVIEKNGTLWMGTPYLVPGKDTAEAVPSEMLNGRINNVDTVSCGAYHAAAVKGDGTLWMWGANQSGQLGNGEGGNTEINGIIFQNTFVEVLDGVAAVSCGKNHTGAVKTDGTLWMWGDNSYGALGNDWLGNAGDEFEIDQTVPTKVMDDVLAVSCGGEHTAAIKVDGSLWMWGNNFYGQLGNGTTESTGIPIKVMEGVAAVSCGRSHTAVIKTDGSLWMWGSNQYGELGNGYVGNTQAQNGAMIQTLPVKVLDNVVTISCGDYHTAAIKTDATLWTWGDSLPYKLCNGGAGNIQDEHRTIQTIPMKVLETVTAVSCGADHTVVLKADGTLWSSPVLSGGIGYPDGYPEDKKWVMPSMIKLADNISVNEDSISVETTTIATPTNDSLTANGKRQTPTVYKVNGSNYFKIRDLAAILNGTNKQFAVGYDSTVNSVTVTTGQPYSLTGTELQGEPAGGKQEASVSNDAIYINGVRTEAEVYKIGGSNYFKLRDLGKALNFYVGYSSEKGMFIEADRSYEG